MTCESNPMINLQLQWLEWWGLRGRGVKKTKELRPKDWAVGKEKRAVSSVSLRALSF